MTLYSKDNAVGLISNMIKADRLCHAFILCGERGVGKKTLAKQLAKQILCEKKNGSACGACNSCLSFERGLHHDFITVTPSGKRGYLMNDLRPIVSDASVSPDFGEKKVYFIPGIDTAVTAAQNVLLKIVEEPPPHVVFIMTAESKEKVLPTILSRTVALNVSPASEDECLSALKEAGAEKGAAEKAVSLYGGNIGRCLEYIFDEGAKKLPDTVAEISGTMLKRDEYALLNLLSSLEKDREFCSAVLNELKNVFRDAVTAKLGGELCSLCRSEAAEMSKKIRQPALESMYDSVADAERKINGNASAQITLSDLCGRLSIYL